VLGAGALTVALAPRADAGGVGPDVTVYEMDDVDNWGVVSGVRAYSVATRSCNQGDEPLNWCDSGAGCGGGTTSHDHPVIAQNLYRLKNGRFEQLGMSWLKHGFTALTQNLCCSCSGQGGSVLGVGCSDPYTASRNGSQSGLGPRYQVNANTGVFTYPPASGTGGSGTTYRRLQVDIADLSTAAGVRYFAEAQYVTQDDATAGNQNNNASYREMSVSGSGTAWTFGFIGGTVRERSAIYAWPVAEPGVTLVPTQVPNDGLFIVGYKATAITGGMYRYEYAVYNMNNDRSGGSFSIPVGNSVTVTNIEFHDVAYRNGDGNGNVSFSGADWTSTRTSTELTWACEAQIINNNANAIRWGTTYNFRFDSDAAPVSGMATLGLWKPGTPTSMSINVDVPAGGPNPMFTYCYGDGSGTACPCGNNSLPGSGEGCLSSIGSGGLLAATGSSSLAADTVVLTGAGMTDSTCLYFQGTVQTAAGAGATFGDGLRCVGGSTVRLGTKTNLLGTSQYPTGPDTPVSIRGNIGAPGVRVYPLWYRNAAAFCTPSTFNLTNGFQILWTP
jgi:hypothetical protein